MTVGRDDVLVTETTDRAGHELPPPTGAPAGGGQPAGQPPSKPFYADWDLPFDDPRSAAEWWFRPLLQPATWINLGYLFVGALAGVIWFTIVIVLLSISLPLVIIGIGIPLTALTLGVVDALAGVERRRAEWVGDPIPPRPMAARTGSWFQRMMTRFTDSTRWRQVAFFMVSVVALPTLFAIGAFPLFVAVQALFGAGWSFSTDFAGIPSVFGNFFSGIFGLGNIVLALLAAGFIGRASTFFGGITHGYVEWFLGPDKTAELEARVDTLSGQRAEILDAVSAERRRIERNLHDGVQQQIVAIGIDIGRAQARIDTDPEGARLLLDEARDKVRGSVGELRMIGRGLHPAVLDDRGLDAALSSIVSGSPIPIDVRVDVQRAIPTDVAETAYYVANEAVANVLKHSKARVASLHVVEVDDPVPAISLVVHDDGRGGAGSASGGTGLAGMAARVEGVDGSLRIASPPGGPTTIAAVIPIGGEPTDG